MRRATLTVAVLGLLFIGATLAVANGQPANAPATPHSAVAADNAAVTPVRQPISQPVARWYGNYYDYDYPRYYTYRPRYGYWHTPRGYYYSYPYSGYYTYPYPDTFGFEFHGPRRSFSFGF